MDAVLRGVAIYGLLLVIFRVMGKRTLGQITTFDLILLLIISEAVQNAMVGPGYSITTALVLVATLVMIDLGLSQVKSRWPRVEKVLDGVPVVIVAHGRPIEDRMAREHVDGEDVLAAARQLHGLERMEQIKFAVLERSGEISIIPRTDDGTAERRRAG